MNSADHELYQLLSAFAGLKNQNSIFFEKVRDYIQRKADAHVDRLARADEPMKIYRNQGARNALEDILEYMNDPEKYIKNIEQQR